MTDPGPRRARRSRSVTRRPRSRSRTAPTSSRPAQLFLTVHGTEADLARRRPAASRSRPRRRSRSSKRRHQIEVARPHAAWDPGPSSVRMAAGSGLWDAAADSYLIPAARRRRRHPGGAGASPRRRRSSTSPSAIAEPLPNDRRHRRRSSPTRRGGATTPRRTRSPPATSPSSTPRSTSRSSRRERDDLMRGKPGGMPTSGPIDRILVEPLRTSGRAPTTRSRARATTTARASCSGGCCRTRSTCPTSREPKRGYGLTLLLHSLGANYNQFTGSPQPVADRRARRRLDRDHALGARHGRLVLRGGRRRHVRGLGRRRPPLQARPALHGDLRLLDGRLRHLQVRDAVPGPVRRRPARCRPAGSGRLGAAQRARAGRARPRTRTGCSPPSATSRS